MENITEDNTRLQDTLNLKDEEYKASLSAVEEEKEERERKEKEKFSHLCHERDELTEGLHLCRGEYRAVHLELKQLKQRCVLGFVATSPS